MNRKQRNILCGMWIGACIAIIVTLLFVKSASIRLLVISFLISSALITRLYIVNGIKGFFTLIGKTGCVFLCLGIIVCISFEVLVYKICSPFPYYILFATVGVMSLMVGGIYLVYGIFGKKWSAEKLFLTIAIPFGICINLITPLRMVPDEYKHIYTAYRISSSILNTVNDAETFNIRQGDADMMAGVIEWAPSKQIYNDYFATFDDDINVNEFGVVVIEGNTVVNNDIVYILPALTITLGRLFGINAFWTLLSGRIVNFVVYLALTYLALKLMPFGKKMLMTISLFPITIQQAFSYSYDSYVFCVSFYILAISLWMCYKHEKFKVKENIPITVFTVINILILFGIKNHAYMFVCLAPVIFYLDQIGLLKQKYYKRFFIFVCGCVVLFFVFGIVLKIFGVDAILSTPSNPINYLDGEQGYTVAYFINHPLSLFRIYANTFRTSMTYYYDTIISAEMGWLNIEEAQGSVLLYTVLLLLASFKIKNEEYELKNEHRFIFMFVSVITIIAILAGMLLAWTPEGYLVILGVQGRYFTPVLGMIFICINGKYILIDRKLDSFLYLSMYVLMLYVIAYDTLVALS